MLKSRWSVVWWGVVPLPCLVAYLIAASFSSPAHIPIVGISGICVALCDALFGQIVAMTRGLPFCEGHSPAQAQRLAESYRGYHRQQFLFWLVAKLSSAVAITISAIYAISAVPEWFEENRFWFVMSGYCLLGVSFRMVLAFVASYWMAEKAADNARLKEMNCRYEKEFHARFGPDKESPVESNDFSRDGSSLAETLYPQQDKVSDE